MVDVHIGEEGVAEVEMYDSDGNVTDSYDKISGIQWSMSDPTKAELVDDDAEPKDARFNFMALTPDGPVTAGCTFDGDPGDGVTKVELVSEEINIVPGPARSGQIKIKIGPKT